MRSTIEELYYGNLNPSVKLIRPQTAYARKVERMSDCETKLMELLDGKELSLFADFSALYNEIDAEGSPEAFVNGFRLGARLAFEALGSGDGCLADIV